MAEIKLSKAKVTTAVNALLKIHKKSDKNTLLESVGEVQLQICLKKIPPKQKLIKLKLPNSLRHEGLDVCLFVKDLERSERDYEPTVRHFQDLLNKHGVDCVAEIIPLKSLKTEYKPFEAKRNLSNAYDVFLADDRIVRLLPTYLGKFFYGKRKNPLPVNLMSKHLSHEIDKVVGGSTCQINNKGSSCCARVATLKLDEDAIAENILSSVTQLAQGVPGGADNIKQLGLKTDTSTSIPLYISTGGPQDVIIEGDRGKPDNPEAEEISTLFGAKVKVYQDGRIKVIKDDAEADQVPAKRPRYSKKKAALKRKKSSLEKKIQTKGKRKLAAVKKETKSDKPKASSTSQKASTTTKKRKTVS